MKERLVVKMCQRIRAQSQNDLEKSSFKNV